MATVGRIGMSLLSNNKSFLLLAENLILIVVNDFQMLFMRKGYDLKNLIVTGVVAVVLGSGYTENVLDIGEQKKNKE
jgi:hypothetical protein